MGKQRLKRVQAGRLVREVLWSAVYPGDTPKARAEKAKCSSAARQAINDRCSWEKLKMVLAANFDSTDLVVTLTYDEDHLPSNVLDARKRLKKFIGDLRERRRRRGQGLRYVYCTESLHGDGRIHHHMVLNGTGQDYELIRSLWTFGEDLNFSRLETWGYEELAKYLTKEPREYGRNFVGERSWVGSRGLAKPEVSPAEWVNADVRLEPPINAHVLRTQSFRNEWGSFAYLEYLLPRPPAARRTRPKRRKFQTDASFSGSEQCIFFEEVKAKDAKSLEHRDKTW